MSLTVATIVELIRQAVEAEDQYLLVRAAEESSGAGVALPQALAAPVVGRYAQFGMLGPAAAWLGRYPELNTNESLISALRQTKDRRIAWSSLQRRFRANLDTLVEKQPELAWLRESAESLEARYELYQAADGNYQIRRMSDGMWLPYLGDHRRIDAAWGESLQTTMINSAVFLLGVGHGWRLEHAWKRTHHLFLNASAPMYLIEPNADSLAIVLHLHHWRDMLADPRVRVFAGEQAAQSLKTFLKDRPTWALANQCFIHLLQPATPSPSITEVITDVHQARMEHKQALEREAEAAYTERDVAYWADRFSAAVDENGQRIDSAEPLRIIGLTTRHSTFLQYAMRDFMDAAKQLGHETRILIEPSDHECREPGDFARACLDFEPDLMLNISRMRAEMDLKPANIPAVCWDQDALPGLITEERKAKFSSLDFLIGFAAKNAVATGWPAARCGQPRMATSPTTYSPERLPDEQLASHVCDISYVSHQSATPEAERDAGFTYYRNHPQVAGLFADAAETLLQQWRSGTPMPGPYYAVVEDLAMERGLTLAENVLADLFWRILRVGDRLFRHEALAWVAEYCRKRDKAFHLYGRGWDQHETLHEFARGEAGNGRDLRAIYQASRINLQLMAFGFVHQRALDGLMAGGFFVARWTPMDFAAPIMRALAERANELGVAHRDEVPDHPDEELQRLFASLGELGLDHRCMRSKAPILTSPGVAAVEQFPQMSEITFRSAQEFESLVDRFLDDEDTRLGIADAMHEEVRRNHSYAALVRDFLAFIRRGLIAENGQESDKYKVAPHALTHEVA